MLLPGLYLVSIGQEEINIIIGIHQTVLLIGIDLKMLYASRLLILYRLVGNIHGNQRIAILGNALEQLQLELTADNHGQHEAVQQVIPMNIRETVTDNHPYAIAGNGPCSVLTTGT